MPYSDIYLYSPLTIKTIKEGHNRALLLQFILSELFHAIDAEKKEDPLSFVFSSPACFFPSDWSVEVGCLNKIRDHARLLSHGFEKLESSIKALHQSLDKSLHKVTMRKNMQKEMSSSELIGTLKRIYLHLEPFLIACRDSETLLVFLLQHSEEVGELASPENLSSLLSKMFPGGLEPISHIIQREYRNRNSPSLLPEIERILSHYES